MKPKIWIAGLPAGMPARCARTEPDFAAYAEPADFVVPIRSDSEYEAHC